MVTKFSDDPYDDSNPYGWLGVNWRDDDSEEESFWSRMWSFLAGKEDDDDGDDGSYPYGPVIDFKLSKLDVIILLAVSVAVVFVAFFLLSRLLGLLGWSFNAIIRLSQYGWGPFFGTGRS